MKYLVKETEYYVDPHGTPDEAGTRKYVVDNLKDAELDDIDPNEFYDDEMIPLNMEEVAAQDGYNMTVWKYKFIELPDAKAELFNDIIEAYNQM